jgi:hypothetical protein
VGPGVKARRRSPALPEADGAEADQPEHRQGQDQRHREEPLVAPRAPEAQAGEPRGGQVGDQRERPPPGTAERGRHRRQLRQPGQGHAQDATPPGRSRTASTRAENSRSRSSSV